MSRPKKPIEDDLLATLKKAILSVLADPKSKPSEKMKAIETGSRLLMIEAKIGNDGTKAGFFDQ